jgi:hypothetical protein
MEERRAGSVVAEELTPFVYDRAQRLDETLARITISEVVVEDCRSRGEVFGVHSHDPDNTDPRDVPTIILDEQFLRGMRRVAFTLYLDLLADGESELAHELVADDDARRVRYGVTRPPRTPVRERTCTARSSEPHR